VSRPKLTKQINTFMKLSDLNEAGDFGMEGVRKDELNQFLTQNILNTMARMSISDSSNQFVLSMSKRLTGTLIDKMFYIRNVFGGKKKYLDRKLMKVMAPAVASAVKAATVDHPELQDSAVNSEEYVTNFIKEIVDNHHQFKRIIL